MSHAITMGDRQPPTSRCSYTHYSHGEESDVGYTPPRSSTLPSKALQGCSDWRLTLTLKQSRTEHEPPICSWTTASEPTFDKMEEQVDRLVNKTWAKFQQIPQSKRLMIAVSGIPGSGKTTLAAKVAQHLNERWHDENPGMPANSDIATFLPMDGYHLTRAQLSAMPDPNTAHARRGAAFTFDAPAFLQLVKELREPLCAETGTVYAPSFDHAVKDPVEADIPIAATSRIVVMEGNYLSLGTGAVEWKQAAEMMDELWFVDVDEAVARRRLVKRHVASGVAGNEDEAGRRADENDLVNGREIVEGRVQVHEVVVSREDEGWKPEEQGV